MVDYEQSRLRRGMPGQRLIGELFAAAASEHCARVLGGLLVAQVNVARLGDHAVGILHEAYLLMVSADGPRHMEEEYESFNESLMVFLPKKPAEQGDDGTDISKYWQARYERDYNEQERNERKEHYKRLDLRRLEFGPHVPRTAPDRNRYAEHQGVS